MPVLVVNISDDSDKTITGSYFFDSANGGKLAGPAGMDFPTTPNEGDWFWRTDRRKLYRYQYDGDPPALTWVALSGESGVVGSIQFDTNLPFRILEEGELGWMEGLLQVGVEGGQIDLMGDVEKIYHDGTALSDLTDGEVVSVTGVSGDMESVTRTNASSYASATACVGMVTNKNADGTVRVCKLGIVHNLDTSGFVAGPVYVDPANPGQLVQTPPTAPNIRVHVGVVINVDATEGAISVGVVMVPQLIKLSDVYKGRDFKDGDVLRYNLANSRWELDDTHDIAAKIPAIVRDPSGFRVEDHSAATLAVDNGTRTFSVTPTGASFTFYRYGVPFVKTTAQTRVFPNIDGSHFFYFDSSGVLQTTQDMAVWREIVKGDGAVVAVIIWDVTNQRHILLGEERHGVNFPGSVHWYNHRVLSTQWISGGALVDIVADGDGSLATHAQFGCTDFEICDEDIDILSSASAQVLDAPAQIPIFYRSGSAGALRRKDATVYPLINSGTAGYTGANGRIAWNQYTGTTWTLTEVDEGGFVMVHYYASNDKSQVLIGFLGYNQYATVSAAAAGAYDEVETIRSITPFPEFVLFGSVIFQTSASYTNAPKARVVSQLGSDYIDWRRSPRDLIQRIEGQSNTQRPINTYRISPSGGDFESFTDALAYMAQLTAQTDPIRLVVDGGSYPVSDTVTIDLPFHLRIEGSGSSNTFLEAATGLTGKPMFDILSSAEFHRITFDGSTLSGWKDSDAAVILDVNAADIYMEVTDALFYDAACGIHISQNADVFVFNFGMYNCRLTGITYDDTVGTGGGLDVEVGEFENCGVGIDLVSGDTVDTYFNALEWLQETGQIAVRYDGTAYTYDDFSIFNPQWNEVGTFLSGFDFTLARDADIEIIAPIGDSNKNPLAYVYRTGNVTVTPVTLNVWTKANFGTLDSLFEQKWDVDGNKITFLSNHKKDITMNVSINVQVANNGSRRVDIGIVKNGNTGTIYGVNSVHVDVSSRVFSTSCVAFLQDVDKNDYFEIFIRSTTTEANMLVGGVSWMTQTL